jgi:hypothetical protein
VFTTIVNKDKNMKHAAAKSTVEILDKIAIIEKDIMTLKLSVLKRFTPTGKKIVKLKGVLKGIDVTDDDILAAKKSLYDKTAI